MQLAMTDVRHEFDGGQGMTSAPLCDDVSGDGNVGRAEAHTMRACVQAISVYHPQIPHGVPCLIAWEGGACHAYVWLVSL